MARSHAERKEGWTTAFKWGLVILALTLAYTLLRYVVFGTVGAEHIPLYLLNKALAWASVILIGISFIIGPLCRVRPNVFVPRLYLRKYFGLVGFGAAAMHSVISLLLFNAAYYPKFFAEGGKLTFEGELSMLFGVLALFIFAAVSVTSIPAVEKMLHPKQWLFVQRTGYIAFLFVLLHVMVMGYAGWAKPGTWPGGLLPISLISFVIIAVVLLARVLVLLFPLRKRG